MLHLFCNQTINSNHTNSSSKLTFNQQKKYDHKIRKKESHIIFTFDSIQSVTSGQREPSTLALRHGPRDYICDEC